MARTTKTPHKVSRNKSGSPIVRASKLFPGRPKRTTREAAFDTEHQARTFADALNLAAVRDGDWRWLKREEWTAQFRYVDEVFAIAQERVDQRTVDGASFPDVNVSAQSMGDARVAPTWGMSITEAVETFMPVYMARPRNEAGKNYASWLGAIGMAFEECSLAEVADMTPEACGKLLTKMIDPKDTTRWHDERVVGSRTVNSRLNSLEQLLRYAIDNDWIMGQPRFFSATMWRAPKEEPPLRWWNITEMAAVRAELLKPRGKEEVVPFLMAELLMSSGLRWGEVAALQWNAGEQGPYYWNAVNPSKPLLSIRVAWKRRGDALGPTKTGNTWSAICTDNVNDALRRTKLVTGGGGTFLFPHHDDPLFAFSYKRWCKLFRRAVDRAGVELPRGYVQKILRHSFVFAARRAKVPSNLVQQHFGHSDTRMVDRIYGRSGREGERFEFSPGELDQIRRFFSFDQFEEISRNVA
jgi:integrase